MLTRYRLVFGMSFGLAAAGLAAGCGTAVPSAPSGLSSGAGIGGTSAVTTGGDAGTRALDSRQADNVSLCHAKGKGDFKLISVGAPAERAHLAHGDGHPGDPYPGSAGFIFGPACEPVSDPGGGSSNGGSSGASGSSAAL